MTSKAPDVPVHPVIEAFLLSARSSKAEASSLRILLESCEDLEKEFPQADPQYQLAKARVKAVLGSES